MTNLALFVQFLQRHRFPSFSRQPIRPPNNFFLFKSNTEKSQNSFQSISAASSSSSLQRRHRPPCSVIIILRAASTFFPPTHQTVSLSLSPTSLSKSGDSVLIQWSGIDSPSRLDWLDIYSPPSSHHDNFIGYKFLSSAPTWKSGSGSISLPLVNLRFNYSFRIFRWNESEVDPNHRDQDHNPLPGTAHLLATSDDELSFESGRVPDQIHLAYTDGDDEMRVMFVTSDGAGEEEGLLW